MWASQLYANNSETLLLESTNLLVAEDKAPQAWLIGTSPLPAGISHQSTTYAERYRELPGSPALVTVSTNLLVAE
jgi:hypothetical protein